MRAVRGVFLLSMVVAVSAMQSPEPPLSEMRLTVHTLLREDIFAGFMSGNMDRFATGRAQHRRAAAVQAGSESQPDGLEGFSRSCTARCWRMKQRRLTK